MRDLVTDAFLPASRLLRWSILFNCHLKTPGDRFGSRLDGRRHAQEILAVCGGILHLDIACSALRARGQDHFVEDSAWPTLNERTQFGHASLAHPFPNGAARLQIWLVQEVFAGQLLRGQDDTPCQA